MLIKCPECGTEVSNKAPHCVHCGVPIAEPAGTSDVARAHVQTIEATAKTYKAQKLVSSLLIIVGVIMLPSDARVAGIAVTFVGLVWLIAAGTASWWNHG